MNINLISFKGIFYIKKSDTNSKQNAKLNSKKALFNMNIESGSYLSKNFDKFYLTVPNENDNRLIKLLKRLRIPFQKVNEKEALDLDNIYLRIMQDDEENYEIHCVNVGKLNKIFEKEVSYIEKHGKNCFNDKYNRFIEFLKTEQNIKPPKISLYKTEDGSVSAFIEDGRHRFAVLRDLGLTEMPILINKDSLPLLQEIELI